MIREPRADRYAVFEDDLIACPNLRKYLERTTTPGTRFYNLITHDVNANRRPHSNYRGWYHSDQMCRGAVGLVFTNESAVAILSCRKLIAAFQEESRMYRARDTAIGNAMRQMNFHEYVHYPSLLQHMESESTFGHKIGKVDAFIEGFDPLSIL
jgi:hypothetical protein